MSQVENTCLQLVVSPHMGKVVCQQTRLSNNVNDHQSDRYLSHTAFQQGFLG